MVSFVKNRRLFIVSSVYFLIMFGCLYHFGANAEGEASKYIYDANAVLTGGKFNNDIFSVFYFSYSLLVSFFIKYGIGFEWLAFLQIVISYISALALYRLAEERNGNSFIALCCFTIYLFCYPVQKWNLFIYTDGIHTSLVVIGLYYFFKLLDRKSLKSTLIFSLMLLLILTTRPVGIIFFISCYLTLIFYSAFARKKKQAILLSLAGIGLLIVLLNSPFRYFINPDSLRRMEVICQVPTAERPGLYTEYNTTGLGGAYGVIKNEIGVIRFFKLGLLKLRFFFGLVRPYYSTYNNLFLCLYLLLYPFAIAGLFYRNRAFSSLRFFCICFTVITAAGIFVTCDEWSGRFIAPVFPFIIIPASGGIFNLYKYYINSKAKSKTTQQT